MRKKTSKALQKSLARTLIAKDRRKLSPAKIRRKANLLKTATDKRLAIINNATTRAFSLGYRLEIQSSEKKGFPVYRCKLIKLD